MLLGFWKVLEMSWKFFNQDSGNPVTKLVPLWIWQPKLHICTHSDPDAVTSHWCRHYKVKVTHVMAMLTVVHIV